MRFDGGHKRDQLLLDTFGHQVEWVPVCPEVELGLGVPRETLRLVRIAGSLRMVTTRTGIDHTDAMLAWARARVDALAAERLSGYVLKSRSPSCGIRDVEVSDGPHAARDGRGLFAQVLAERWPHLPIEDEARLHEDSVRRQFMARVVDYHPLTHDG